MQTIRKVFYIILPLIILSSCVSRKRLTYLQNSADVESSVYNINRTPYLLQVNDILNISIRSGNQEVGNEFNLIDAASNVLQGGDLIFYLNGYSVNSEGEVNLPTVGRISVVGKSLQEIKTLVDTRLRTYFKDNAIFSTVQLAGIRFTVVGEVNSPGLKILYQNDVNIFEALGSSGDITTLGDRKSVQILRRYPDGIRFFDLDLTDKKIVSDPNFFILPNDVINVKPLPAKSLGLGTSGFGTIAALVTLVSSTLLIIVNLQRL